MKTEFFLQKIKAEFPELKWKSYKQINQGWDHIIIILDEKIVFRFPKNKKYKDRFQKEIQLLDYLNSKVKVNIPQYRYISKDKLIAGYDMVSGRELTHSRFIQLIASEKSLVAKQLADFISILHATPKSVITKFNVVTENQEKPCKELIRDTRSLLFPRLSKKEGSVIEQYFIELNDALGHSYSNALVHNDLTWEHILWDSKNKQVGIIDFSDLTFGDPAIDFNGLLEYGVSFTKKILKLYSGKKDNQMLQRSQLYFKKIPIWFMRGSLKWPNYPCTFDEAYKMFKKRFKI